MPTLAAGMSTPSFRTLDVTSALQAPAAKSSRIRTRSETLVWWVMIGARKRRDSA